MSIKGCQVEPIGSLYEWEREPLTIIKDGCQADHVGLVCPPQKTEYGIRVVAESFRYQTTSKVQYSCLVRICPFTPCPTVMYKYSLRSSKFHKFKLITLKLIKRKEFDKEKKLHSC